MAEDKENAIIARLRDQFDEHSETLNGLTFQTRAPVSDARWAPLFATAVKGGKRTFAAGANSCLRFIHTGRLLQGRGHAFNQWPVAVDAPFALGDLGSKRTCGVILLIN